VFSARHPKKEVTPWNFVFSIASFNVRTSPISGKNGFFDCLQASTRRFFHLSAGFSGFDTDFSVMIGVMDAIPSSADWSSMLSVLFLLCGGEKNRWSSGTIRWTVSLETITICWFSMAATAFVPFPSMSIILSPSLFLSEMNMCFRSSSETLEIPPCPAMFSQKKQRKLIVQQPHTL